MQARLRAGLVEVARVHGARLDVYVVLRDVIGADALVQEFSVGDGDLLIRRIVGAPDSENIEGQRTLRRRESNPPFALLLYKGTYDAPPIPVVVAPDPDEPSEYIEWALYEVGMKAAGATEEGIRAFRSTFRHKKKRMRVRIDGRIKRVYCLPLKCLRMILRMLGDCPNLVRPKSRAYLERMRVATEEPFKQITDKFFTGLASAGPRRRADTDTEVEEKP